MQLAVVQEAKIFQPHKQVAYKVLELCKEKIQPIVSEYKFGTIDSINCLPTKIEDSILAIKRDSNGEMVEHCFKDFAKLRIEKGMEYKILSEAPKIDQPAPTAIALPEKSVEGKKVSLIANEPSKILKILLDFIRKGVPPLKNEKKDM